MLQIHIHADNFSGSGFDGETKKFADKTYTQKSNNKNIIIINNLIKSCKSFFSVPTLIPKFKDSYIS